MARTIKLSKIIKYVRRRTVCDRYRCYLHLYLKQFVWGIGSNGVEKGNRLTMTPAFALDNFLRNRVPLAKGCHPNETTSLKNNEHSYCSSAPSSCNKLSSPKLPLFAPCMESSHLKSMGTGFHYLRSVMDKDNSRHSVIIMNDLIQWRGKDSEKVVVENNETHQKSPAITTNTNSISVSSSSSSSSSLFVTLLGIIEQHERGETSETLTISQVVEKCSGFVDFTPRDVPMNLDSEMMVHASLIFLASPIENLNTGLNSVKNSETLNKTTSSSPIDYFPSMPLLLMSRAVDESQAINTKRVNPFYNWSLDSESFKTKVSNLENVFFGSTIEHPSRLRICPRTGDEAKDALFMVTRSTKMAIDGVVNANNNSGVSGSAKRGNCAGGRCIKKGIKRKKLDSDDVICS